MRIGLLLLDIPDPAPGLAQVRVVGATERVGVEPLVGWDRARAPRRRDKLPEAAPVPVAGEVAVIHQHRAPRVDHLQDLQHRVDRPELVRRDAGDPAGRAAAAQDLLHPVPRVVEVVLVADEDELGLPREHLHHVGDDRLAVDLDKRLGDLVTGAAEPLAET